MRDRLRWHVQVTCTSTWFLRSCDLNKQRRSYSDISWGGRKGRVWDAKLTPHTGSFSVHFGKEIRNHHHDILDYLLSREDSQIHVGSRDRLSRTLFYWTCVPKIDTNVYDWSCCTPLSREVPHPVLISRRLEVSLPICALKHEHPFPQAKSTHQMPIQYKNPIYLGKARSRNNHTKTARWRRITNTQGRRWIK